MSVRFHHFVCSCGRWAYPDDPFDVCAWGIPGAHGVSVPLWKSHCKINAAYNVTRQAAIMREL